MTNVTRNEYLSNVRGQLAIGRLSSTRVMNAWPIAECGNGVAPFEGRADGGPNQGGKWNLLNTTRATDANGDKFPGTSDYNSVGVKNYATFAQGVEATVLTLREKQYAKLLELFRQPDVTAGELIDAIAASQWGTKEGLHSAFDGYMRNRGFFDTLLVGPR